MNLKLEVASFELQKVKLNAKKGLVIDFYDKSSPNELWNVDSDSRPHEDLTNSLSHLQEVLAYSLGLNNGWDFAREHNRKNEDALKKAQHSWKDEILRCDISGLSLVGSGDNQGIKITGSLKTDLGVVGLSSPTVRFDSEVVNSVDETVMIGDLAETAYNAVQLEVWKFIFKGKRGGELFGESETAKSGLNITPTPMQKVG